MYKHYMKKMILIVYLYHSAFAPICSLLKEQQKIWDDHRVAFESFVT